MTVVATDPAGNTSAPVTQTYTDTSVPAQTVTIDTYADDVLAVTGSFGSGTTTNDTTPVLNGTLGAGLGAGEVVRIYEGATLMGTANVVGTTWTFNLPALADGSIHSYTAVVEDAAGNQGTASSVFTVIVDTAAPADATAIAITAVSDDSGHSSSDFITSDTSLTVSGTLTGTLAAGEAAQISVDDGVSWTDLVVSDGAWSYDDGRTLADGEHDYLVRVVDRGGNVGATGSRTVTVDTAAPADATAIAIVAVSDDSGHSSSDFITSDTSLTVSGTLTGTLAAGEAAQISVDDGVSWTDLVVSDGAWSYDDGRTLADGDHDYLVRVVDQGGNVGATGSRTVTVDTAAPADATAIAIVAVSDDSGHSSSDFITSDTSLTVSGTLTGTLGAGEAAQISIDDGASWTDLAVSDGAWSYDDGRTLADGDHDYLVRVVDQGGNVGATGSRTVTVDTAAPADATAIAIVAVSDDSGHSSSDFITSDTSLTVSGTLTGTLGAGETAQISIDDGVSWTDLVVSGGAWSYDDGRTLADGDHDYLVRVVDQGGNVGATGSRTVTVDASAPTHTATIDNFGSSTVTDDTTPVLSGTLSAGLAAGEVVRIYDGATLIGAAIVVGTAWTFDLPTLAEGSSHSYTAVVEDAAGNAGTASSAFTLTVDTSAPTQTVTITSYTDDVAAVTGSFGSDTTTNDTTPVLNGTLSAGLAAGEVVRVYDFLDEHCSARPRLWERPGRSICQRSQRGRATALRTGRG